MYRLTLSAALTVFMFSTAGAEMYCPWADAVLKLRIQDDTVELIETSLGSVPAPGIYKGEATSYSGLGTHSRSFVIIDQQYVYLLELIEIGKGDYSLWNRRIPKDGGRIHQGSGACLIER